MCEREYVIECECFCLCGLRNEHEWPVVKGCFWHLHIHIWESVLLGSVGWLIAKLRAYEVLRFFGDRMVQRNTFWQLKNVLGKWQLWQKLRGPDSKPKLEETVAISFFLFCPWSKYQKVLCHFFMYVKRSKKKALTSLSCEENYCWKYSIFRMKRKKNDVYLVFNVHEN